MLKKLALDAVMGVLGVLLTARFGGGVTLRFSTSAEGAGNDEIRLLKGVLRGSKFNGGSLIGCKFFFVDGCATGVRSGSDPEPTVRPRRCLMEPVLPLDISLLMDWLCGVSACGAALVPLLPAGGADGGGAGMCDLNDDVEKLKLLRSGSFGDSYAFGIAGTGGTSSGSSPPAELCTFLGFGVGKREPDNTGLARVGMAEPPLVKEFRLEFEESDIPEAYDLRFCSGVARADEGVTLLSKSMAGELLKARSSKDMSPCGVGGATGPPGALGFIERRFNLRASVGLIVLAPRPEMWCTVDCRLAEDEEGV